MKRKTKMKRFHKTKLFKKLSKSIRMSTYQEAK